MARKDRRRPPVHPGEILKHEFLNELGVTAYRLAKDIQVPSNRITGIVNETRAVTADTALRLARYFNTSAEMWMNLQSEYDLEVARRELGAAITEIKVGAESSGYAASRSQR